MRCESRLFLRMSSALAIISLSANTYAIDNEHAKSRRHAVDTIVIHAVGGPDCSEDLTHVVFSYAGGDAKKWKTIFDKDPKVSIHYIVDRQGHIEKSIDEDRVAWHAGDRNGKSIGIELVNRGDGLDEYPTTQIDALRALVNDIKKRHPKITNGHIVRHSDVDHSTFPCAGKNERRKRDPGPKFPYDAFIKSLDSTH